MYTSRPFQGHAEDFRISEAREIFLSATPNYRLFGVALRQFRCGAKEKVVMKSSLNPSFIKAGGPQN